jgi:hypothetical protein
LSWAQSSFIPKQGLDQNEGEWYEKGTEQPFFVEMSSESIFTDQEAAGDKRQDVNTVFYER